MPFKRALPGAAVVVVLGAVAAPSGALAAPSAYDQYVPLTPSASGPTAPGGHGHRGGPGSVPLTPAAAANLRKLSGPDRAILEAIATSRDFGASSLGGTGSQRGASSTANGRGTDGGGANAGGHAARNRGAPTVPPTSSTLSAAADAIGHSPVLPLTLFAALAGALAAGALRRRRA